MTEAVKKAQKKRLNVFERYLTLWVVLCIVAGTLIGNWWPAIATWLSKFSYAQISIPVAVLIWLMIYPMMLQIDFASLKRVGEKKQGLIVTTVSNWLIKPFTMYAIAWFFLNIVFSRWIPVPLAREYLAGAVLLGAAPCTAMVFVWSYLADGDPAYTLVQVAVNDLIILVAYAPIVMFLLGLSKIIVPYDTVILSVVLFVVVPLVLGWVSRVQLIKRKGIAWFEGTFLPALAPVTITALLLTLVIIFIFQGQTIVSNPLEHRAHRDPAHHPDLPDLRDRVRVVMAVAAAPPDRGPGRLRGRLELLRAGRSRGDLAVRPDVGRGAGDRGRRAHRGAGHALARLDRQPKRRLDPAA